MSVISSCPQCARPITIPAGASPSALVRCPICQAEYPLQSALENLPPMLVLVNDAAQQEAISEMAGSSEGIPYQFEPQLRDAAIRIPATEPPDDDFDFESADLDTSTDESKRFSAADSRRETGLDLSQGAFGGKSDELLADSDEDELDAVEFGKTTDDDDEFNFDEESSDKEEPAFDEADADEPVAFETEAPVREPQNATPDLGVVPEKRKKRREPSALANLIGVVGGGVIGLSLGYFILLMFGGPQYDIMGIGPKLPSWMVSSKFHEKAKPTGAPVTTPNSARPTQPQLAQNSKNGGFKLNVDPLSDDQTTKPADNGAATASGITPDDPAVDPLAAPADLNLDDPSAIAPLVPKKTTPAITDGAGDDEMPADDEAPAGDEAPADDEMPADDTAADPAVGDEGSEGADDADSPPANTVAKSVKPSVEPTDPEPADDASPDSPPSDDATPDDTATPDSPPDEPVVGTDVPAPPEKPGVRQPHTYTLVELGSATKELRDVIKALAVEGIAKEDYTKLRNQYYRKFAHLGQVLTFAADDPAEPRLANHRKAIEQTVSEAVADEKKVTEIGKAGAKWMTLDPIKRGEQGVVLAGTVESVEPQGRLFAVQLALPGGQTKVSVLSASAPDVEAEDTVIVLGSIMEDPANSLVGYDGAEATVVWNGAIIKLSPQQ